MQDSWQRSISYARISITNRCNLRCVYCMPEEGVQKFQHEDILSYEEIITICKAFAKIGINKLKITGGEPLVRKGVVDFVANLKEIQGIDNITMTTNALELPKYAADLKSAGLDSINISLDSLNPERYHKMTRNGNVNDALNGLYAALDAGFKSVKINSVLFNQVNEDDIIELIEVAHNLPVHVRFIEMMPIGMGSKFKAMDREKFINLLQKNFTSLTPVTEQLGNGPAKYFSIDGFQGKIGFIATLDHDICSKCNRLRLTSEGILKACLHMDRGLSLREVIKLGEKELLETIKEAISKKPEHHNFGLQHPDAEIRGMSRIGG